MTENVCKYGYANNVSGCPQKQMWLCPFVKQVFSMLIMTANFSEENLISQQYKVVMLKKIV